MVSSYDYAYTGGNVNPGSMYTKPKPVYRQWTQQREAVRAANPGSTGGSLYGKVWYPTYQQVRQDYPKAPPAAVGGWTAQLSTMPTANPSPAPSLPAPAPESGNRGGWGGGWGGGGGGGGGGGMTAEDQKEAARRTAEYLMGLLENPMFTASYDEAAAKRIGKASKKDLRAANQSYRQLNRYLRSPEQRTNPYAGMRQPPVLVNEQLGSLAASQGIDPAAYNAERALINTEGRQQNRNYNNLTGVLRRGYRDELGTRRLESRQARDYARREIGGADNAMLAYLSQQQHEEQLAKDQQKLQVMLQLAQVLGPVGAEFPTWEDGRLAFPAEPVERTPAERREARQKRRKRQARQARREGGK